MRRRLPLDLIFAGPFQNRIDRSRNDLPGLALKRNLDGVTGLDILDEILWVNTDDHSRDFRVQEESFGLFDPRGRHRPFGRLEIGEMAGRMGPSHALAHIELSEFELCLARLEIVLCGDQ